MTKPLTLHRFTDLGMREVERQLMLSRTGRPSDFTSLLTKEQFTESLGGPADVVPLDFKDRWACGRFFCEFIASRSHLIQRDPETDRGLWTWLAIAWRDYLKKPGRSPRSEWPDERWVLGLKYSRYYKHLLAGPWLVYNRYRENPETCRALLLPPITTPGHDISEHFLCKYELVNSPELVAVVGDCMCGLMAAVTSQESRGVTAERSVAYGSSPDNLSSLTT